jgi:hypothetical protein
VGINQWGQHSRPFQFGPIGGRGRLGLGFGFGLADCGFARVRDRIRPEFLTGDEAHDTVTLIEVAAASPRIPA